jgi:uncharacterized membrane protein
MYSIFIFYILGAAVTCIMMQVELSHRKHLEEFKSLDPFAVKLAIAFFCLLTWVVELPLIICSLIHCFMTGTVWNDKA